MALAESSHLMSSTVVGPRKSYGMLTALGRNQAGEHVEPPEAVCSFDHEAVARTLLISLVRQGETQG
jgi:hypothetical protein